MSHVLQCDYLSANLFLRELLSGYGLVLRVVRTIQTAVDAVVREVQRSEENDSVSVERKFDFLCNFIDAFYLRRVFTCKQH